MLKVMLKTAGRKVDKKITVTMLMLPLNILHQTKKCSIGLLTTD